MSCDSGLDDLHMVYSRNRRNDCLALVQATFDSARINSSDVWCN